MDDTYLFKKGKGTKNIYYVLYLNIKHLKTPYYKGEKIQFKIFFDKLIIY